MKMTLERPQIIKDAENTFFLIKTKNKIVSLILEILLAIVVFFLVEMIFGMITGMGIGLFYGVSNASEIQSMMQGGSLDVMELSSKMQSWQYYNPITLNFEVFMTALTILFCKFYQKRKVSTLGFVKKNAVSHYLYGMVLGFVLFAAAVLICVLTGAAKVSYDPETFKLKLFIVYFVGWLFQGMAEEVMCRGYILTSIARKNNLAIAVLGNSLFFAGLHLGNPGISPLALVNLTLFGIFASIVYIKSGNIWLCSAMHSIWNMVQGNFFGVLVSGQSADTTVFTTVGTAGHDLINGADFGFEGGLAVTLVYVIAIVIALFFPSIKKNIEKEEDAEAKAEAATEA